ncbi:hypothetical protein N866_13795, partial [Actinotalea ferrariae CF5-4]
DVPRQARSSRRLRVPAVAVIAAGTLAGCTGAVPVEVAPYAADPLCAEVVLALPRDLGEFPRRSTTSQATVAWGDPADPVVLRCGVEPPGPTTDRCVNADDGETSVDWISIPGDETPDGAWRFTTYGRVPAVEVVVPAAVAETSSTSFILDLGPAVARVEQTRACL